MARPKSNRPTKSKKISARLTEADYMKIKAVYGSIQAFLDLMVKTLPIFILVSCNAPEAPQQALVQDSTPVRLYKTDYAVIEFISRGAALSYKLSHNCDEYECEIYGDLGTYLNHVQYNGTGYLSDFHFPKTIIRRADGDFYQGQICSTYNLCYELRFNPVSKYAAVSNGTVCMVSNRYVYEESYNSFINTFSTALGTTGSAYLQFLWAPAQSVCGF